MTITRSMRSLIVSIPTACLALLLAASAPSSVLADEADTGTAGHGAIAAAAAGGSAGSSSASSGSGSGVAGSGAIAALAGGASGETAAAADEAPDESGDAAASSPATSFSTSGLSGNGSSADAATAGTASGSAASSAESVSSGEVAASSGARFAGLSSLAASLTGGSTDVQQTEGFSYTVSAAGTATIVEYSGAGGAVEIPTSIDGYAVTAIGDGAFGGNGAITSVVLPEGVTSIGNLAFAECPSLAEISLPEGVSFIGYGAFYNDDLLTSIALPASLARCGAGWGDTGAYGPFGACDGLVEVTLAEGMATVPADLLTGCPAAVTVDVPATVTAVGSNAFAAAVPASICGAPGSFAESYAAENGLAFTSNVVPATAVTLGETSSQLAVDETCQLTATVEPANTTDKLTWSSSDESVATVDAAGLVSARGAGTATITAAAGAVSATCEVRVVQPVESISLNKKTLELEATETRLLQPQILPDNATDKGLVWSSSDESVATVDAAGVVTAVGKGEAQITAVAADGYGAQASCSITVTNDATIATSVEQLASPADYGDNRDDIWLYTLPGAQSISVTFDTRTNVEDGFDFVDVYDGAGRLFGRYTGASLAGKTLVLEGDTVKIKLVTDASTTEWGFGVTSVAAVQTEGWQVIDGVTYYYIDGAPARGELLLADGWHYFNENTGAMVTGLVTLPDGRIVYYDARGVMLTGEVLLADGWHYFDPVTGCMAVGLTMMPDHTWRYYDYAGVMRTGDVSIGNTVYHFDQNTGIMVDNDVTINDVDITQNETNITNNTVINVTIEEGTRADDDTEPTPDFNGDDGEGTGTPGEPAEGEEPAGGEGDQPAEDEQPAGEEGEQPAEGEEPAAEGEEPAGEPTGEEQADVPAEQEQPADTAPVEDATEPEQPVEEEPAQEDPVTQESNWGLTVGEDGHVVTDYFDFYLPSYWIGKVEVAFLPAAENNGIDAVVIYPAGYPSAVLARFEMFDSSTEINGGDIASGLAGYWDNGAGQRVELWQTRWTVLLANSQAREVGATDPVAGAEAQVVDLLTGGAYTLDQVYAAANESDAVAMGAFGDGALFPSVFVPHYAADGTVDGYAPCWGGDITQAPFSSTTIPASWYSLIEPLLPSEVVPAETQEPAAAEEAPVEEAAPAPEEAPAEESVPTEEVPVEEQAAPEDQAPVEEQAAPEGEAPAEEAAPIEEAAPVEETAPVDSAPAEETAPAEEPAPVEGDSVVSEENAPTEEPVPTEETVPAAEEGAPIEEAAPAPTEETAPTEEAPSEGVAPAEEVIPTEEVAPVEETAPAEEAAPAEPAPAEEAAPAVEEAAPVVELSTEERERLECMASLYIGAVTDDYGTANATGNLVVAPGAPGAVDTALVLSTLNLYPPYLTAYTMSAETLAGDNPFGLEFSVQDDGMTHIPVATAQRIIQSFYGTCPEDLSYLGGADSGIPLEFTGSEWVTSGSAGAATIATASANVTETDGTVSFDCLVSFMVGADPAIDKYYHVTAVRDDASMFGFHLVSVEEVAAVEGLTL